MGPHQTQMPKLLLSEGGDADSGRGAICSHSLFEKHCPIHALNAG